MPRLAPLALLALLALPALPGCDRSDAAESTTPTTRRSAPAPQGRAADSADARARALETIGYASHGDTLASEDTGVLEYDPKRASNGARLYTSGHSSQAWLMAPNGTLLHHWDFDPVGTIPHADRFPAEFRRVLLTRTGTLLGIVEGRGLVALDAEANVLWKHTEPVHHDVREAPDGTLYALDRHARPEPRLHPDRPILDDGIVFLSADGEVLGRASLLDAMLASEEHGAEILSLLREDIQQGLEAERKALAENAEVLAEHPEIANGLDLIGDVTHFNSIERIGPERATDVLHEGWYLLSCRELSALLAVEIAPDRNSATLRWFQRGAWKRQHEASLLMSGRLLLFDNQGGPNATSRALEIDPRTGAIAWQWPDAGGTVLDSKVAGMTRRLANGNTLLVESTKGRALEVTPDGRVPWIFLTPHRAGEGDRLVASLPQLVVLDALPPGPWTTEPDALRDGAR